LTSTEIRPDLLLSCIKNNLLSIIALDDAGAIIDIVTILIYRYHRNVQISSERRIFMIASASLREGGGVLAEVILSTM